MHRNGTATTVPSWHRLALLLVGGAIAATAATAAWARPPAPPRDAALSAAVELRRTTDGIAHVRARGWRELGLGVGYAQAEDALCTLAEAFVTFQGRRSAFFGPQAMPARDSTFGRPKNLELDVFFKAVADAQAVQRHRAQQPPELNQLIEGFADGYNRHLADRRGQRDRQRDGTDAPACLHQPWVADITADDIHRRMLAATLAGGYAHFIPEIVQAAPAGTGQAASDSLDSSDSLSARLAHRIGQHAGIGSNAIAFGQRATGGPGGVLLGNPHWYWGGPDRFYQMHLSIPGRLNVAGVAFLGIPVVMIGFNEKVAWTHTVSEARRFGLFQLALDAADPTRYVVDGVSEPMQRREIQVEVRRDDGRTETVTRVLHHTRFGFVVDFSGRDPAFGWGRRTAIALRDANADNFRVFRNFLRWNQARSLDEFIAIQRQEGAVPWVNTVAIGQGDGRAWFADVGVVPNVPDALRAPCSTALAQGFARADAITPFLDGSRAACDWPRDPRAVQAGAMPTEAMPSLLREDYVANMNDSYWLTQPAQPLEGYPTVLGGEREPQSLRSGLGHAIARELSSAGQLSSKALGERLMRAALQPRVRSAELHKEALMGPVCRQVSAGQVSAEQMPATQAELSQACDVLRRWGNTGEAADRGALLWEAFWARVRQIPAQELFERPFSPDAPLDTPMLAKGQDLRVARALADTVADFRRAGHALDRPVGDRRYVRSAGERIPLHGGCHDAGYFSVACAEGDGPLGPDSHANSYLQVVRFGADGVEAHTLLAHGQRETAVDNGPGAAPVRRYASKAWLRFPFTERDIARDPGHRLTVLRP